MMLKHRLLALVGLTTTSKLGDDASLSGPSSGGTCEDSLACKNSSQ